MAQWGCCFRRSPLTVPDHSALLLALHHLHCVYYLSSSLCDLETQCVAKDPLRIALHEPSVMFIGSLRVDRYTEDCDETTREVH